MAASADSIPVRVAKCQLRPESRWPNVCMQAACQPNHDANLTRVAVAALPVLPLQVLLAKRPAVISIPAQGSTGKHDHRSDPRALMRCSCVHEITFSDVTKETRACLHKSVLRRVFSPGLRGVC